MRLSDIHDNDLISFGELEELIYGINPIRYIAIRNRISDLWEGDYLIGDEGEGLNPTIANRDKAIALTTWAYGELKSYENFIENRYNEIESERRPYGLYLRENPYEASKDILLFYHKTIKHLAPANKNLEPDTPDLNNPTEHHDGVTLPDELDTDRSRKYFARAVELGYMKPNGSGYKWVFCGKRGGLARLGYFVERVFCPTNTEELPEQAINTLFGVNRIGSAITQLHNAKKPQKWRAEIDKLFID